METHLERLMCLSGVIVARMVVCHVAEKRHCLIGFRPGWSRHLRAPWVLACQTG